MMVEIEDEEISDVEMHTPRFGGGNLTDIIEHKHMRIIGDPLDLSKANSPFSK